MFALMAHRHQWNRPVQPANLNRVDPPLAGEKKVTVTKFDKTAQAG
jgi:hypothetical protein